MLSSRKVLVQVSLENFVISELESLQIISTLELVLKRCLETFDVVPSLIEKYEVKLIGFYAFLINDMFSAF